MTPERVPDVDALMERVGTDARAFRRFPRLDPRIAVRLVRRIFSSG